MAKLLLIAATAVLCHALIEDLKVENDDRSSFHIESFGFAKGGHFEAQLEMFSLMVPHDFKQPADDGYEIAFVLQRSDSDLGATLEGDMCFHTSYVSSEDLIVPMNSRSQWTNLEFKKTIRTPGYYHLYYSNCMPGMHTSFHLKTTQYNFDAAGRKVYLGVGLASVPTWYFLFFLVFLGLAVGFFYLMRTNLNNVRNIHYLMLSVAIFKALSLFCETFVEYTLKVDGVHDGWSAAFYVFSFIKGMVLFTTVVLIGTGWSHLKPFLTDRDKTLVVAVVVMQAMVNVAMIAVGEATPGSYGGMRWRDILNVLDVVCCIAVLFPLIWSIRHLRSASGTHSKAARNEQRLSNFRTFYILVIGYVYFTRILLFLLGSLLPYDWTFIGPVFNELAAVVFYSVTGYLFRPQASNPYMELDKHDDSPEQVETL